jgi:hypothetical protein
MACVHVGVISNEGSLFFLAWIKSKYARRSAADLRSFSENVPHEMPSPQKSPTESVPNEEINLSRIASAADIVSSPPAAPGRACQESSHAGQDE